MFSPKEMRTLAYPERNTQSLKKYQKQFIPADSKRRHPSQANSILSLVQRHPVSKDHLLKISDKENDPYMANNGRRQRRGIKEFNSTRNMLPTSP